MLLGFNKKEKILAIFVVFFLFLAVGALFFIINQDNRQRTEQLRKKARQLREIEENKKNLEKITIAASSTWPEISSKSFLVLAITNDGISKVLATREENLILPIASLTKLMLAVIIKENFDQNTELLASRDYIGLEESYFVLEDQKKYRINDLLTNALIASDNDSARLLTRLTNEEEIVRLMNKKAESLNLMNTNFINVTGLDPQVASSSLNVSTATDLAKLLVYIKDKHPEILKITTQKQYEFCSQDGLCKTIHSTNKLLEDPDFKFKIIGGKTGNTDRALRNLALIITPVSGVEIISVVLGSGDNFMDTRSLIKQIIIN